MPNASRADESAASAVQAGPWSGWTPWAVEEAKRRYLAGESCSTIARALAPRGGLTRNAVIGKLTRARCRRSPDVHVMAKAVDKRRRREDWAERQQAREARRIAAGLQKRPTRVQARLQLISVVGKPLIAFGYRPSFAAPGEVPDELGPAECHYPLNEAGLGHMEDTVFCALPVREGDGCYCPGHAAICLNKTATAKGDVAAKASTDPFERATRRRFL